MNRTEVEEEYLYLQLIHEGLQALQQRSYFEKLKQADAVTIEEALALLAKAPDVEPLPEDRL